MKRTLLTLLLSCSFFCLFAQNDPVADKAAQVVAGNARFTVLTDRLIRMEWDENGVFEDNATLAIINRKLPVPAFKTVKNGEAVTIKTSKLTLSYLGGGKFTDSNLSVSFTLGGRKMTWKPGADASANLKGTTRTLDGCTGFDEVAYGVKDLEDGIVSRDGWAIVDESQRHILVKDDSDWGEWIAARGEGDRQDLYIFAYGHDYKAALADFTKVAGNIPLPPKYTLGYWWSRYWVYTDEEMLDLAREMRSRQIPIDVMIVDMDWHHTWKDMNKRLGRDEFDQRRGWTGYTWNGDLFPDPEGFLRELHSMNLKTSLNLHPASGIRPYEDCYRIFREDYLQRVGDNYDGPKDYVYGAEQYQYAGVEKPAGKPGYNAPVPFRMSQQEWADAYFNSVIHPLERQGVDFWWLDWQQWKESRYVKDLSNTFWLNYTFFNDKVRQTASLGVQAPRALIYHRWGGLGSHRYQLGFSGDTYDDWSVLAYLPYFTATASNVGYGYWGHDIGGHQQHKDNKHPTDPEVYTRWLQYGVFTPIFKTHSTTSALLDRRIWKYESHYQYMKEAIELRYALTPYIYDAARQCYETGVGMCRPLYYDYPEVENAYSWKEEFMFGDNILATSLCQPMNAEGKTERKMWFPAGNDWYDMAHHCMYKGGSIKTLYYTIDENPWYAKAGCLIPMAHEGIQNLQDSTNELRLLVVPGGGKAVYTHYEDDGNSMAYDSEFSKITFSKTLSGKTLTIRVSDAKGTFKGKNDSMKLSVVLPGCTKTPSKVSVNGVAVEIEASVKNDVMTVTLPQLDTTRENIVVID